MNHEKFCRIISSCCKISHITCLMPRIASRIFKELVKNFLVVSVFMIFFIKAEPQAACRGEGFMGISSRDPIMSWVDLTYSPVYSSASTSGTLGCKNWDFGYERYTEYVLRQFLKSHTNNCCPKRCRAKALILKHCPD